MAKDFKETTIPFMGFYNSWHSDAIDREIEQTFDTDYGEPYSLALSQLAFEKADYRSMFLEIAKSYVDSFNERFGLHLEYSELVSPREYNFTTDRIFCKIHEGDLTLMYNKTDTDLLRKEIVDTFTSYDGFISSYKNDLDRWPSDINDWDHNQIGCLVAAYVKQENGGHDLTPEEEYELAFGDSSCFASQLVNDHIKDERVWKIFNYLREREERVRV